MHMKKFLLGAVATVATFAPLAAFADSAMWNTASTTDALGIAYVSIGAIFAVAIASILGAWAALHGLGYGIRKAKKHAVGGAF